MQEEYEISYEILYGEDYVRLFFIQNPTTWYTKEDVLKFLEQKGRKLTVGSLYNTLSLLKRLEFLESKRSIVALYRLKELENEIHPMGAVSRDFRCRPKVFRLDFFKYLEGLSWENVQCVHDVHFWAPVRDWCFVDGNWKDHPRSKYRSRCVVVDGFRVELRVYYQAGSFTVVVACADRPVAVGFEGLVKLYGLLSDVRASCCSSVPSVKDWMVKQWHFGRDCKGSVSGADFELSFQDWFGHLARIYTRHDGKVRLERVENPNVKFGELLEDEVYDVSRPVDSRLKNWDMAVSVGDKKADRTRVTGEES